LSAISFKLKNHSHFRTSAYRNLFLCLHVKNSLLKLEQSITFRYILYISPCNSCHRPTGTNKCLLVISELILNRQRSSCLIRERLRRSLNFSRHNNINLLINWVLYLKLSSTESSERSL